MKRIFPVTVTLIGFGILYSMITGINLPGWLVLGFGTAMVLYGILILVYALKKK